MILSSRERLEEFTADYRMKNLKAGPGFHDLNHPDVEKLLSTSPPLPVPHQLAAHSEQSAAARESPRGGGAEEVWSAGTGSATFNMRRRSATAPASCNSMSGAGIGGGSMAVAAVATLGVGGGGANEDKQNDGNRELASSASTEDTGTEDPADEEIKFERSAIRAGEPEAALLLPSLLSSLLANGDKQMEKNAVLPMRIYLPDCSALEFEIDDNATVEDVIFETLRQFSVDAGR